MTKLSPIKLTPAYKDYIWGGTKLKTMYNKHSALDIVAESWELSAHKDGESIVADGPYSGLTLTQYLNAIGNSALGTNAKNFDYFPILIKLIDARSALSVQVHPDDSYALEHEGEYGKTEMWYILDCEENASLYYGFKKDVTKKENKNAIEKNTLTDILNKIPVHKGDVFFIPAGTVHAIGAGILICEIQQNSNTTYRVYDYNRRDKKGNTRPLHVEKAIAVSNLSKAPEIQQESDESNAILAQCEYFTVREITVADTASIDLDTTSFRSLIVTEGSAKLEINHETLSLEKGNSIFVPAQSGRLNIYGNCTLIMSQV